MDAMGLENEQIFHGLLASRGEGLTADQGLALDRQGLAVEKGDQRDVVVRSERTLHPRRFEVAAG